MSLEAKIEALTAAVAKLTAVMEGHAPAAVAAPVVTAPVAPPVVAAPVMPAAPTFAPPAPAAAPSAAPFSDPKGLIDYVMATYKILGPQKGAQIQSALTALGYQNINDVKPEHYGQLFASIEALKV